MSKSEFDDLLRKKIAEEELEYDPENWNRISSLLPPALPNRSRKWTVGLGIAAALALLLATTLLVKLMDQTSQIHTATPNQNATAQQYEQTRVTEPRAQSEASETGNGMKGKRSLAAGPGSAAKQPLTTARKQKDYLEMTGAGSRSQSNTLKKQETTSQSHSLAGAEVPEDKTKVPLQEEPNNLNSVMEKHPGPIPSLLPGGQVAIRGQRNVLAGQAPDPYSLKNAAQTSVAFGGGVNYGSLNAGYSLNITAQQKIGDRFFFDGTVAVMYNNNTPNNIVNSGAAPMPVNTAARPAQKPTLSTPAVAPVSSLYYIQFNPSVGYQLADNLAISVGGDLQQMLAQDDEFRKYQVTEAGTRVFPGLDLGFTGKTEYSITPQIQAGLIFREGLNNFIKPNQELPFVNRRYIQVQFKYNIPIRR